MSQPTNKLVAASVILRDDFLQAAANKTQNQTLKMIMPLQGNNVNQYKDRVSRGENTVKVVR